MGAPPSQLAQLKQLLQAIGRTNRFYAPRLAGIHTDDFSSVEEFSQAIPFTTKTELVADQAAHPPHGTNLTFPDDRYTRYSQTSGTSGIPLVILDTNESWTWMLDNWSRVYSAAGVSAADRIFFAFSFGPFLGFWTAFESATRLGCLCLPGGGLSSATRLKAIIAQAATVLCCTPTYALRLGEVAREEGIDLGRSAVRTIIVAGEPGGSSRTVREAATAAWNGAQLFDHYGLTEAGPVAYQDPQQPYVLHIPNDRYYAEVVDPESGKPASGEIGELVLTPLGRAATPLLRYRTGDLVRIDDSGRGDALALMGGIIGRVDDMIVVRGVNVHPVAVDEVVRSCPGVGEYQVRVERRRSLPQLEVRVEPLPGADVDQLSRTIESALSTSFSLRIPVTLVQPQTLPRWEMKARRWIINDDD